MTNGGVFLCYFSSLPKINRKPPQLISYQSGSLKFLKLCHFLNLLLFIMFNVFISYDVGNIYASSNSIRNTWSFLTQGNTSLIKFSIRAMRVAAQRKSLQSHTRSTLMVQKQVPGRPPTTHLRECIQLSADDCLALTAARHGMFIGKITHLYSSLSK